MKTASLAVLLSLFATVAEAAEPADIVFQHGYVFTADAGHTIQQAAAERAGVLVYVGDDDGVQALIGPATEIIDLKGRILMPGLIDGHMHPLEGGLQLLSCNLAYAALTVVELKARVQTCLDEAKTQEPDGWLDVENWFRQAMLPPGTAISAVDLDDLKTSRPIAIHSSDGHTILLHHRALALAGVKADAPNPSDGSIGHDQAGALNGLFEDGAQGLVTKAIPTPTDEENITGAKSALAVMAKQGITSFLDAAANYQGMDSLVPFNAVAAKGQLTARAHFAWVISPDEAKTPKQAAQSLHARQAKYDSGALRVKPAISFRTAKLFLDGVTQSPPATAAQMTPYNENVGTAEHPHWVPGKKSGDLYFPQTLLSALVIELAKAKIDPHLHADGAGAVHTALNAIEAMRKVIPASADIRPAVAHNETILSSDYIRYVQLNATPVLSFQWGKRAPDTVDSLENYIGPERYRYAETAGFFHLAGVRIAYGSDWPVDALDEWFALKVGVTRKGPPGSDAKYAGRLGVDPGLPVDVALRAITINAAYELHDDKSTGSIEPGKFADLIILDRNPMLIAPGEIAAVKVDLTMVGGLIVYRGEAK
jgi:predicted amidohydrolase YtcJ